MQYLYLCKKLTVVVKIQNRAYINKKFIYADNSEFLEVIHNIKRTMPNANIVITNKILGPLDQNAHIATISEIKKYISDFVEKVEIAEKKASVTL